MSYIACSGAIDIYNNTWGHTAPQKNTTYKGVVTYFNAQHGEYGGTGVHVLEYYLNDDSIYGPYIHDLIINYFRDNDKFHISNDNYNRYKLELYPKIKVIDDGWVYESEITIRNYVLYVKKPVKKFQLYSFRKENNK